ncbi:MAG TPA: BrnT family toxin [Pirellulales bacterium]|nr:BrnT family toxin [Pirellulales bacterium]
MEFEWDPDKAAGNLAKHSVSFHEAATVFGDPLAVTYFDPDHSGEEDRFLTFGHSSAGHVLVVSHTDRGDRTRIITARRATRKERKSMKQDDLAPQDELRPEYDLSQLKGGVRGKYLERYRDGTNLALLASDVRAAFPTDEAVNRALRSLMQTLNPT